MNAAEMTLSNAEKFISYTPRFGVFILMLYALAHAVDFLLHAYIAAALAANGPQWMLVPALFLLLLTLPMSYLSLYATRQLPFVRPALFLLFGGIVFVAALLHLQEAGFYAFLLIFYGYCAAMSYVLLAESPTYDPNAAVLSAPARYEAERTTAMAANGEDDDAPGPEEIIQYPTIKARHSFAQVLGMDDIKRQMLTLSQRALQDGTQNGIILSGKPGNGKTFVAEALAGQLDVGFLSVDIGSIQSKWIGESTERINRIFADAFSQAPCVLFLDEVDSLLIDRGAVSNPDSESLKVTNALLARLVDARRHRVVIVAATNHPDRLDGAGIRDGRFDLKVTIPTPNLAARIGIMTGNLGETRYHPEVIEAIAQRWEGFSVSRIAAVAKLVKHHWGLMEKHGKTDARSHAGYTMWMEALRIKQNPPQIGKALRFADLVLTADARTSLTNLAANMRDPLSFEHRGAKLPVGVAFIGPPGTGKTATAKALAKESGWTFLPTTGMDLMRDGAMEKLIDKASDLRPAMVFIDEADDILQDRSYSGNKMQTNKLLSLIDGEGDPIPDVMFVAATNHFEAMDAASRRRFTNRISFAPPDGEQVMDWVRRWQDALIGGVRLSMPTKRVAQGLTGCTMAQIKAVLQEMVNSAAHRRDRLIGQEDFDRAMKLVLHE